MTRGYNDAIISQHDRSRVSPDYYKVLDETRLLRQSQNVLEMIPAARNSMATGRTEPSATIYLAIHSEDGLRNRMRKRIALHFSRTLCQFMSLFQLTEKRICFRI